MVRKVGLVAPDMALVYWVELWGYDLAGVAAGMILGWDNVPLGQGVCSRWGLADVGS